MSDYKDRKGISHWTEWGSDAANFKYLKEERAARDELRRMQARMIAAQEEQAEVAREQAAQVKKEIESAEEDRAFTRDIQWLEHSDSKGRLEFLVKKELESGHMKGLLLHYFRMWHNSRANSTMAELAAAFAQLVDAKKAAKSAEAQIEAQIGEQEAHLSALREAAHIWKISIVLLRVMRLVLFCVIFGVIIVVIRKTLMSSVGDPSWGSLLFKGLITVVGLWLANANASVRVYREKEAAVKLQEQKVADLKKQAFAAQSQFSTALQETAKHRDEMVRIFRRDFGDWLQAKLMEPKVNIGFPELIDSYQERYPSLCRVQLSSLPAEVLEAALEPLAQQAMQLATEVESAREVVHFKISTEVGEVNWEILRDLARMPESAQQAAPQPPPIPPLLTPPTPPPLPTPAAKE